MRRLSRFRISTLLIVLSIFAAVFAFIAPHSPSVQFSGVEFFPYDDKGATPGARVTLTNRGWLPRWYPGDTDDVTISIFFDQAKPKSGTRCWTMFLSPGKLSWTPIWPRQSIALEFPISELTRTAVLRLDTKDWLERSTLISTSEFSIISNEPNQEWIENGIPDWVRGPNGGLFDGPVWE